MVFYLKLVLLIFSEWVRERERERERDILLCWNLNGEEIVFIKLEGRRRPTIMKEKIYYSFDNKFFFGQYDMIDLLEKRKFTYLFLSEEILLTWLHRIFTIWQVWFKILTNTQYYFILYFVQYYNLIFW